LNELDFEPHPTDREGRQDAGQIVYFILAMLINTKPTSGGQIERYALQLKEEFFYRRFHCHLAARS
jgi:hypothetical protein